jgi:hypothetical protein
MREVPAWLAATRKPSHGQQPKGQDGTELATRSVGVAAATGSRTSFARRVPAASDSPVLLPRDCDIACRWLPCAKSDACNLFVVKAPESTDEIQSQVVDDVDRYGWHGVSRYPGSSQQPDHYYTVGIHATHGQPEILIMGLAGDVAHRMARGLVEAVGEGLSVVEGLRTATVLDGLDVTFARLDQPTAQRWLPLAAWYYADQRWVAAQLLWPDSAGRFPGQDGYAAEQSPQPLITRCP